MSAPNDGSEDVDQFLARIASLSKKSGGEDAEQTRRTEEQMMQAKKERQARRAERARSISPSKSGPAGALSSPPTRSPVRDRLVDPRGSLAPQSLSQTHTFNRPETPTRLGTTRPPSALDLSPGRQLPQLPHPSQDPVESPSSRPSSSAGLSRSGTLSWQQRPSSRGIGSGFGSVRSRPLSGSRAGSRGPPDGPTENNADKAEDTPSRHDIATALGSHDPAWFRQTQDRGLGSAAYRRSDQNQDGTVTLPQQGLRLPGMADGQPVNDSIALPPKQIPEQSRAERSPRVDPPRGSAAAAYVINQGLTPSVAAPSPTEPLKEEISSSREPELALDRSSNTVAGRPPSPTKGLGGFVQSAMMRRSDSVSKRWSVQAGTGLKRGDSIASNKPNFTLPPATVTSLGHVRTLSRDPRDVHDGTVSPQSTSRPTSSHSAQTNSLSNIQKSKSEPHGLVAPHSSRASVEVKSANTDDYGGDASLPRSPSKTLDPRRWSPTKASWLESALSKPESPRYSPTKEETPSWKLDMQRSKSNRDLSEVSKTSISHEPVSPPSLLRSTPPAVKTKPVEVQRAAEVKPQTVSELHDERRTVPAVETAGKNGMQSKEAEALLSKPESVSPLLKKIDLNDATKPANPTSADSFRSSIDRNPPALKPKPETPPKVDLRANLKTRTAATLNSSEEPEFKAVFGKLKKAQTQNYVAPDMLKDNITRGKAALNTTGGPQPRKRVDEFKESILAQKEAMRAGHGSIHKKSDSRDASPTKPEKEVPEALQRRNTLHKSKASLDDKAVVDAKVNMRSPPKVTQINMKPTWSPSVNDAQTDRVSTRFDGPSSSSRSDPFKSEPYAAPDTVEDKTKAELTEMVAKSHQATLQFARSSGRAQEVLDEKPEKMQERVLEQSAETPSHTDSRAAPSVRQTASTKSSTEKRGVAAAAGLAARLNPALAGLIARGGSPKPGGDGPLEYSSSNNVNVSGNGPEEFACANAENLTHMTKGRAKGPKRKAPKASSGTTNSAGKTNAATSEATEPIEKDGIGVDTRSSMMKFPQTSPTRSAFSAGRDVLAKTSDLISSTAPSPGPKPSANFRDKPIMAESSSAPTTETPEEQAILERSRTAIEKAKSPAPAIASKSPELRRVSGQAPPLPQKPDKPTSKTSPRKTFAIATDSTLRSSSPTTSLPPKTTTSVNSPMPMPLTPSRSTVSEEKSVASSGLSLKHGKPASSVQPQEQIPPREPTSQIPQQFAKTAGTITRETPVKEALGRIFGKVPRSEDKADFDTELILSAQRNHKGRIKTVSNQIWEVSGDGKRSRLPQQQEHVLFEDNLYLVVHSFESAEMSKKATECYLWVGDSVPSSAAEDAQLFCRKIAREHGAKLEVVTQGKESANFFAALGGIVVFRKSKASALYMLCGRRHLGHVTFDEVDFLPSSLCSGFPYLISARYGKLFLWKGQGSGADEIGAARLIGMDLGLTGEIEEVAEGKEPAAFWECFSSTSKAKSHFKPSDIWAMRSMDEKNGFPCRFYRLESEQPKSSGGGFWGLRATSPAKEANKATLTELEPFVQADLEEAGSVHVLDAWASIYVIPGSKSRPADFVSALHIAQEMAVLTPSMQDRALLPSCEVVLGGIPSRDVRAAFRKFVVDADQKEGQVFEVAEVLGALD